MDTPAPRKVAIICSHAGLDECYPALILANAARQSSIEAFISFTFWGLDAVTDSKSITSTSTSWVSPPAACRRWIGWLPGVDRGAPVVRRHGRARGLRR